MFPETEVAADVIVVAVVVVVVGVDTRGVSPTQQYNTVIIKTLIPATLHSVASVSYTHLTLPTNREV